MYEAALNLCRTKLQAIRNFFFSFNSCGHTEGLATIMACGGKFMSHKTKGEHRQELSVIWNKEQQTELSRVPTHVQALII